MINTDYSSMYGQLWNAGITGKTKGVVSDKSKLSKNMDYLEAAKIKADTAKEKATKKTEASGTDKKGESKEITQEDLQKLYAQLNGINYGSYDGKDSYRQMANSFLNQMVFSHMGSSNELFAPQMSHNVLSAAFNAAYDYSDVEDRIRQKEDTGASDKAEAADTE